MLMRYNEDSRLGIRVELHRTRKGSLVQVRELIDDEYETTRKLDMTCLSQASKKVEKLTREYEADHRAKFDKCWLKG